MRARSRIYQNALSETDRMTVRFVTDGRDVLEFAVQYDAFIEDKWHQIVRYDNAHGTAHRHVYYPDGTAKRFVMGETDNNGALTEAQDYVKENFITMRERYIMLIRRGPS